MAKSTMTRAQALEFAINFMITVDADAEVDDPMAKETVAVLTKMHEQLSKPRTKAVSKARKLNESLAAEIVHHIPAEGMTSKDIVNLGNPAVTTTQKAVAVMRVAEELGLVTRVKDGKKISYKATDNGEDA
jgi:CHAT domain-containing protein